MYSYSTLTHQTNRRQSTPSSDSQVSNPQVKPETGILKGPGWSHPLYSTRWHTKKTRDYLDNPEEISAWMAEHKLRGWTECMLDDDCPTEPPRYSAGTMGV